MNTLTCSLVAVVSLAVTSEVFAAGAEDHLTGTVVASDVQGFVIETATKKRVEFHMEAGKPKMGEKVTVYYDISRRDHRGVWFAMKIEKAGKAE